MWTLDKSVRPDHAAGVFSKFYGLNGLDVQLAYWLAALEFVLLFAFVAGIARRWSYGIVLLLHGVSSLSPWRPYSQPFDCVSVFDRASNAASRRSASLARKYWPPTRR